jgi:TPR repeat protein
MRNIAFSIIYGISFLILFFKLDAFSSVLLLPKCPQTMKMNECIYEGKIDTIYIFDEIHPKDLEIISYFSSQLPINKRFPDIVLNSDGGSIDAAIGIGRILRWRNASVVTRDLFLPDRIPLCFSACVLLAAGATDRNLDIIGLHSGYSEKRVKKNYEKAPLSQKTNERIQNYYSEMGIPSEIIEIENRIPFNQMEYFVFKLDAPLERQKIHQLGFRMRGSNAEDVSRIGKWLEVERWSNGSLNQAAKSGNAEAQFRLGQNALDGRNGWARNSAAALLWLNKAADQNHIHALHLLGVVYSNGSDDIAIDKKKAAEYYLRAAKLGNGNSQNNLAWAYYKGDGVDKNLYEAVYWATKATERGNHFSYGSLGAIRFETDAFVRDDKETYMWLKLGTDFMPEGNARQSDLGLLNRLKERMTKDKIKEADMLVDEWKPLYQSKDQMADKDD